MKRRMGHWLKVTNEFMESYPDISLFNIPKFRIDAYKKGMKMIGIVRRREGTSGDDFMRNMYTYVLYYDVVKIPRIINPLRDNKVRSRKATIHNLHKWKYL